MKVYWVVQATLNEKRATWISTDGLKFLLQERTFLAAQEAAAAVGMEIILDADTKCMLYGSRQDSDRMRKMIDTVRKLAEAEFGMKDNPNIPRIQIDVAAARKSSEKP